MLTTDDSNKWSNVGIDWEMEILEFDIHLPVSTLSSALLEMFALLDYSIFRDGESCWDCVNYGITGCLPRIQTIWHSDNIFTNCERHLSTLQIDADDNFSRQQFIWRAIG